MSKAYQKQGHKFRFKVLTVDGQTRTLIANTKVKKGKKKVEIMLKAEHIEKALDVKGFGNTENCMMAICAKDNKFPHPVDGYIDWQYATCFVVSKVSKQTGLPSECYVYKHNCKNAQHFDKFTRDPASKKIILGLLEELKEKGPIKVTLLPPTDRKPRKQPKGKITGVRAKTSSTGAHLRFAVAHPGL